MYEVLKQKLIEIMEEMPGYTVSGSGIQHTIRCPYCGDSQDPNHAHLSVRIDPEDDSAIVFRCFKCNQSGLFDEDTLADVGIRLDSYDMDLFRQFTKKAARTTRRVSIRTEPFFVPSFRNTPLNQTKLAYLNVRLGTNIDLDTAKDYKIIVSLEEFLRANQIVEFDHVSSGKRWVLENHYIGFLSTNNNCITMRRVPTIPSKNDYRRYDKIYVNPLNMSPATFYSIPAQLNLLYDGELHVHIAEGTFDILSVKENVKPDYENQLFYAACGFGYTAILRTLVNSGICTRITMHLYADNDKTDVAVFGQIKFSPLGEFVDHIIIHRNGFEGEKDFGVTPDRIIDQARVIY